MNTKKITPAEAIAVALTCLPLMSKRLIGAHGKEVALVLSAIDQAGYDIVAKRGGESMTQRTDFWTEKECTIAAKLYRVKDRHRGSQHRIFKRIAAELGRTVSGINARFQEHGPNFIGYERTDRYRALYPGQPHCIEDLNFRPSEVALAERDKRLLLEPRDLTAALSGDPLPGYSALDRLQQLRGMHDPPRSQ